jgi:hypothetical protein
MALPGVPVVSIRLARVTFVTRRGGTARRRAVRLTAPAGWVTSACGRSQMRPVACDCVIRTQPALETIHAHAGLMPAVCRLPPDPTDECPSTRTTTYSTRSRKMDSQRTYARQMKLLTFDTLSVRSCYIARPPLALHHDKG